MIYILWPLLAQIIKNLRIPWIFPTTISPSFMEKFTLLNKFKFYGNSLSFTLKDYTKNNMKHTFSRYVKINNKIVYSLECIFLGII